MVKQYPYQLETREEGIQQYDDNGNPLPPTPTWTGYSVCRDEDGNGEPVTTEDGKQYHYSFLVQMPKGIAALKAGTRVRVLDGTDVRATGVVVYSRKDQLHTRAWL